MDGRLIGEHLCDNALPNGVPFFCALKREFLTPAATRLPAECDELKTCAIANLVTVSLCIIAAVQRLTYRERATFRDQRQRASLIRS